jgi:hypothetical protein
MGEVRDMDEDGPNDSPYEMLAKHDQSETKRDNMPGGLWSGLHMSYTAVFESPRLAGLG